MPIDAVWCLATVPKREFEEKLLEIQGKKHLYEDNDGKIFDDLSIFYLMILQF